MIAYKVLRETGQGHLISAACPAYFTRRYFREQWNISEVGGLLVFSTEQRAWEFCENDCPLTGQVWRAYCLNRTRLPRCRVVTPIIERGRYSPEAVLRDIWNRNQLYRSEHGYHFNWPHGSQAYRRLRLIERIF